MPKEVEMSDLVFHQPINEECYGGKESREVSSLEDFLSSARDAAIGFVIVSSGTLRYPFATPVYDNDHLTKVLSLYNFKGSKLFVTKKCAEIEISLPVTNDVLQERLQLNA